MNRLILLVFAIHGLYASTIIADDYLLRVETIGYEPTSEKEPNETILRSIEVMTRPQSAFHRKVTVGTETQTVAGTLRPDDDGGFRLEIQYDLSVNITEPGEDGIPQSRDDKSSAQTTVAIAVGNRVTIGGFITESQQLGKPKHKSKIQYVVSLTKYRSPNHCRMQQNHRMHGRPRRSRF